MPENSGRSLLTVLGLGFGLAVTVGNIIGAGVLQAPGDLAALLPTVPLFLSVWVIGAIYAFLGANALAELATLLPRSGGQYVFVRKGLGDYAGFIVGWSDWLSTCSSIAITAAAVGQYALVMFPKVKAVEVVALSVIAVLTIVQWLGVRWGGAAQDITSALKALVFIALIAVCFYLGSRNPWTSSVEADHEGSIFLAYLIAMQAMIYTYDGWSAVAYFSEEVKASEKNIPRSMFGGVAIVVAIYLLMNLAFLSVVPLGTIAGKGLAAGVVAQHLFGPYGDRILRTLVIISLISAVNSNVLMAPRVIFAMARDRLFWRGAREVNSGGTPDIALLVSSLTAAAFVIWSSRFAELVAMTSFFFVINYMFSFIALIALRRREPNAPRPFKTFGYPYTTILALLASLVFLGYSIKLDMRHSIYTLVLLAFSAPIFFIIRSRREA